ncbi:hypothetical protein [Sphingomonas melonis]|uniref:hypothetical protein n=1 Tax=Sphingomonas melonis TaxID=152682 RepID=UPI00035CC154|nr:hypothetical protein [Sphingomonas melonis]
MPGCALRRADVASAAPPPVAVKVEPPRPPAELLACADRPAGLPEDPDLIAQIPTRLRAAIIRLARAFGANADRQDRLIDWHAPGSCPVPKAAR